MIDLRPPTDEDRPALARWRADGEIQRLLMGRGSAADVDAWIERRIADPDGVFRVIEGDAGVVGFVQLHGMRRIDRHAYLGLFVDESVRGMGVAAAALGRMEAHAARELLLRKIVLEVLASNERALRFWRRHGYRTVGTLAGHFYHAGAYHDVVLLEKLL